MNRKNWHISHSQKFLKQVKDHLKMVDLVLEVVDARAPAITRSRHLLDSRKKQLLVLHKADLAQEEITRAWEEYFSQEGVDALPFHLNLPISPLIAWLKEYKQSRSYSKFKRPLRLMVLGMPNVGKSTLINMLQQRRAARTGNKPGITRGHQWVRLHQDIEMLDTPGILPPATDNENTYCCLSALGVLPPNLYDEVEISVWLLGVLSYSGKLEGLEKRYQLNIEEGNPAASILEEIGRRRGCFIPGGNVDLAAAAGFFLKDFRDGLLGRFSFEAPKGSCL